jgi:hypothetical protein
MATACPVAAAVVPIASFSRPGAAPPLSVPPKNHEKSCGMAFIKDYGVREGPKISLKYLKKDLDWSSLPKILGTFPLVNLHNCGKSPFLMRNSTISMTIF